MLTHVIKKQSLLLLLCSILFFTPARTIVIFVCPFIVLKIFKTFHLRQRKVWTILLVCAILSSFFGLYIKSNFLSNVILSFWIVIPIMYLNVANFKYARSNISLTSFLDVSSKFLLFIDFLGVISYFIVYKMKSEDAFGIPYGLYFLRVHGLALLNAIYFLYYLSLYIIGKQKDKQTSIKLTAFFLSFMLCFYGLGTILLLITLLFISILIFPLKKILITLFFTTIIIMVIDKINHHFLDYTIENIQFNNNDYSNKRKIQCFINYGEYVKKNIPESLFGTGPGGFNSRIAFFLNKESNNTYVRFFGHTMPKYHKEYIYPLKNNIITSFDEGTDGTRNQPFSSLISVFAEYGILFGILFYYIIIKDIYYFSHKAKRNYLYTFLFLSSIYFLLNLFTEQWLESSEYIFYLLFRLFVISEINQQKNAYDSKNYSLLLAKQ